MCIRDSVLLVTLAHVGHGQVHAGDIHALFGFDGAVILHHAADVGVGHVLNAQADQTVIQHDAVSYTHLDVYKRQIWGGSKPMEAFCVFGNFCGIMRSYQYKNQRWARTVCRYPEIR